MVTLSKLRVTRSRVLAVAVGRGAPLDRGQHRTPDHGLQEQGAVAADPQPVGVQRDASRRRRGWPRPWPRRRPCSRPGGTSTNPSPCPSQPGRVVASPSRARAPSEATSATMLRLTSRSAIAPPHPRPHRPTERPALEILAAGHVYTVQTASPAPRPGSIPRPVTRRDGVSCAPERRRTPRLAPWLGSARWAPSPAGPPTPTGCVGSTAGWPAPRRGGCGGPRVPPVVVDLGYGASPVTAVELHDRLRRVRPDVEVVGIEIEPDRVALGKPARARRAFVPARWLRGAARRTRQATVVRAFNVLRQYDESEVGRRLGHGAGAAGPGRAAGRRHLRRARPAQRLDRRRAVRPGVAQPVLAAARAGPPLRHRRAAAQVADPPQRRGRAGARLAAGPRPGLGARRPPRELRCAATLPGRGRVRARRRAGRSSTGRPGGGWARSPSTGRPSPRAPATGQASRA